MGERIPAILRARKLGLSEYEEWVVCRCLVALMEYREYHLGKPRVADRRKPLERKTPRNAESVTREFLPDLPGQKLVWRRIDVLRLVFSLAVEAGVGFETNWDVGLRGPWPGIDQEAVLAFAAGVLEEARR